MAYKYERFGSLLIPTHSARQPTRPGKVDPQLQPLASGGGYSPYGQQRLPRGPIQIPLTGTVYGMTPAAIDAQLEPWFAAQGTRNRLYRRVQGGLLVHWIDAWLIDVHADQSPRTQFLQPVDLVFETEGPVWNGNRHGDGSGLNLDSGESLDTGLVLDYAGSIYDTLYPVSAGTQSLVKNGSAPTNAGNAPQSAIRLTLTAGDAPITSIALACGLAKWTWTGVLATGQALVIDTGAESVTTNGADAYSGFVLDPNATTGHRQDAWLTLLPGGNPTTVTLAGGGTGSTLLLDYNDGWA